VDSINQSGVRWNEPGQLFGYDISPRPVTRVLYPIPPEPTAFPYPPPATTPVVTDFVSGTDQPIATAPEPPPGRDALVGPFAAVRASRILHQHRIQFWALQGPIRLIVGQVDAGTPDPDLTGAYNDFLMFNYLPGVLVPSQAEFEDWSRPRKRPEVVQGQLSRQGITTGNTASPSIETTPSEPIEVLIPINTPFRESLSDYCASRLKTRIEAGVGVGAL